MKQIEKGNAWALLPIFVFMVIYLLSSLIAGDFYKIRKCGENAAKNRAAQTGTEQGQDDDGSSMVFLTVH